MSVRQRKEVQEMPRHFRLITLVLAVLAATPAAAAIWPQQIWEHKRKELAQVKITDNAVWQEYGLEAAESATYDGPGGAMKVAGYRLKDPTSALGVYQWLSPTGGTPSKLWKTGVDLPGRTFLLVGNYVLDFQGRVPPYDDFQKLYVQLPHLDGSSLPALPNYLPKENLVEPSRRYVIGPVALEKFYPGVPPSVAGFSMGAEAQIARFQSPAGEIPLAIFNYPTPQMAREKLSEFQKLTGAVVKRSGPLVAVVLRPRNVDAAERLLAKVNYQAVVTWNESSKSQEQSVAEFLLNVFMLIGILMVGTVVAGVLFFGGRHAFRKATGRTESNEAVVRLRIDDKPQS
jgi:hypothetical protein